MCRYTTDFLLRKSHNARYLPVWKMVLISADGQEVEGDVTADRTHRKCLVDKCDDRQHETRLQCLLFKLERKKKSRLLSSYSQYSEIGKKSSTTDRRPW